ncbi:UDP-2,3-diacylglucosamine diphosphatase [Ferruginibacter paludis]|uniref:UDP-2,3-diacylglucosamine diphosphatase n=1 Tax=Ferruginibacter paludis TaxID=1310417 RepID=UPI0025B33A20|nr:UDP-2,3-diacylglucosamine diphosphatase [Ferruginibacter paludis]MDN3658472.1 UDP-2,3-diacylglucosamine diphosphatase [Ferruginibacter paludis]
MIKRKLDVAVISDVHLGTYGSRANELSRYLSTIDPAILILNGDIIDIWQFSKKYWPPGHMQVIKQITSMLSRGIKVYYVTGNHDEMLRRFEHFSVGDFHIVNKMVIHHGDGKRSWIFHGDVFDVIMQHSKWLAKLGAVGYDTLIYINAFINYISKKLGKGKISLSKKIKNSVKGAVKHINNFEETAASIAIEKGYDYVLCGHIHQPANRTINTGNGSVNYLNSGDWIENLTALEYDDNKWAVYYFQEDKLVQELTDSFYTDEAAYLRTAELFKIMMQDFAITS